MLRLGEDAEMYISADLQKKLKEILGIESFRTGVYGSKDIPYADRLQILTIWCAKIPIKNQSIIGVVESNKWRKAIVLQSINSLEFDEKEQVYRPNPTEYKGGAFELASSWIAPVAEALHAVDLMYRNNSIYGGLRYTLFIDTWTTQTRFEGGDNPNPTLHKLAEILGETVRYFVDLYDDEELQEFITLPWYW
jgi:hypothetical protein